MRLTDYYSRTTERSEAWADQANTAGFAPEAALMTAARPLVVRGERVLDIGCQGGHQLALVRDLFGEAAGIDIADYTAMWQQFPDIDFSLHDVDSAPLPFPDAHFDFVICTNVIEHVFDVFGLVGEIARVVRPGGQVLINVPNIAHLRHIVSLARGRVPRTGAFVDPFTESDGWDGQHLHYFTPTDLGGLLSAAGLTPSQRLHIGRHVWLKRRVPRLLDSTIALIAVK